MASDFIISYVVLAVTLTGKDPQVEWDVLSNDDDYPRGQKLIIKQILLGHEAKDDEFNVVEVSCFICTRKRSKVTFHLFQIE